MILGTAAYMAPEQAKGRVVDRRADIWAFGAVLFEMLTGKRAFPGEDFADTFVSVMSKEPDWSALPSAMPAGLRALLGRCLKKDARARVQAIGDARVQLEELLSGAPEEPAPAATRNATTPTTSRSARLAWIAFAVAVLGLVAMTVPALRHLRETPPPAPPETRLEVVTPATDRPTDFALSPDGRAIVFVASGDGGVSRLWLRALATTTAQPLAGTEGARYPFWSPDSRSIGFFTATALKRLDLSGGVPQTLVADTETTTGQGGTWNADGVIVFSSGNGPLKRVSATGGAPPAAVTMLGPQQTGRYKPFFLPDGQRFLFYVNGPVGTSGIYLGAMNAKTTPTRLVLSEQHTQALYVSASASAEGGPRSTEAAGGGGWLLWMREGTVVAQRLDLDKATLSGGPIAVADAVVDADTCACVSVAAAGLLAYRSGSASTRQLTWVDRSGAARGTIGDPDATLADPRVSPDGRRVAVARTVRANQDIWLLDGVRSSRFTFDAANDWAPLWSRDGARLVFHSNRAGPTDLYEKLTSGAGAEERFVASDQFKTPYGWSADGRFLLYGSFDPQTNTDVWVVPMVGDHTPSVFLKTPFREAWSVFSPDDRWVAYMSNESGRMEIYVRPFVPPSPQTSDTSAVARDASADKFSAPGATAPVAAGQWQVSTAGGIMPLWRPDGKELFYINPSGALMAAPITVSGPSFAPGAPVMLFPTRIYGGGADAPSFRQYDVAPDGRFLINTVLDTAAAPITLIQNWNPITTK